MRVKAGLLFAGVLFLASPVAAHMTTPSGGTSAAPVAAGDPNEVLCRRTPPPIGTRMGARRQCATRAEWQRRDAERAMLRRSGEEMATTRACSPDAHAGRGDAC